MKYSDSVKYLESHWKFGIKLGLHRINKLLLLLDSPQNKIKCIHVAGTNGKGSVCAMLSSILTESGYKTGLFTSPHLLEYTERFKINGANIPKQRFARIISEIKKIIAGHFDDEKPTEFEILTAAAFVYFAREKVDLAVIEVGLGGRLDSTNVIEPILSIITSVSYDHTDVLGKTLAKIAFEKAGIIKQSVTIVTGKNPPEVVGVIKKTALKNRAELMFASLLKAIGVEKINKTMYQIVSSSTTVKKEKYLLPFLGLFQVDNLALAVAAAKALKAKGYGKLTQNLIAKGIQKALWPGRFQVITSKPIVVIDGSHNPHGAKALAASLKNHFHGKKVVFVIGVLNYKDYPHMFAELLPLAKAIVLSSPSHPAALDPDIMMNAVKVAKVAIIKEIDLLRAVGKAKELAGQDGIVCITGSLFLAGDALRIIDSI